MIVQLKIQLKDIRKPPAWRKVLVPAQFSFEQLHQVIQAAFGWSDRHLYAFSPKGYGSSPEIGVPDDTWGNNDIINSKKIKLSEILSIKGQKFTYIYDFGDDWEHKITVEEVIDKKAIKAQLISGKGACPPEDCGGVWGYEDLLSVVNDPKHEEYEEMREWLGLEEGEFWDVNEFDLVFHQETVAQV